MVGPYGQPLGLDPLGRVFRAGALTLKRGGRSLQLSRRYAPTYVFPISTIRRGFRPFLLNRFDAALLDVGRYELGPTGPLLRQLTV